jgi:hypothetical protein
MSRRFLCLSLVAGLFLLAGCAPQARVKPLGSDFSFVQLVPMNPDHHPATRLHYKSKEVWPIVFDGYGNFVQDGVVVFVGLLPYSGGDGSDPYQQLLAVRGGGVPLLLSERLLHQKLSSARDAVPFRVQSLSLINDHFRVEFKQGGEILVREFSWADVNQFLDEGESSERLVRNRQVDYRVLP